MDICVDFDGTCVTHEFPLVGQEIGASYVLKELVNEGHNLILFTMRSNRTKKKKPADPTIQDVTGAFLDDAVAWFAKHEIHLYGINTNPTQKRWTKSPKAYGQMYIDDAALGTPLILSTGNIKPFVDWEAVYIALIESKVINKPEAYKLNVVSEMIEKDLYQIKQTT